MPFLSIVIPAYNVEQYINDLLKVLIPQLNEQTELIIVDDGSTDNTASIIEYYALNNENIRLAKQTNSGASATRNKGIDLSQGDYITFIDSDDLVSNDYIETVLQLCTRTGADIIQFNYLMDSSLKARVLIDYKDFGLTEGFVDFNKYGYLLLSQKINALWNKAFKSSIIKDNGIVCPKNMTIGEDVCFVTDALYYARSIYYADKAIYHYRTIPGSIMNSGSLSAFSNYKLLLSNYKKFNNSFRIVNGDILCLSLFPDYVFYAIVKLSSNGYSNKMIRKAIKESNVLKELKLFRIKKMKPLIKTLLIKAGFYRLSVYIYNKKNLFAKW